MPENQTQPGATPGTNDGANGATPEPTFEGWFEKQDDSTRALISKRMEGFLTTVKATRDERDNFAGQMKGVAKDLEEGSKARKALDELTAKYEQSQRQAGFYEDAIKPELGCTNPKAAFLVASADSLFDRKGNPDWAAIKAAAPELFGGHRPPPGNAGAGTQSPPISRGMNEFIRGG